jgi:hypothetical protein
MTKLRNGLSSPFETPEAREAFKEALRAAFTASRALTDFLEIMLQGDAVEPMDAIEEAAAEARNAQAAWALFARLSDPVRVEGTRLN